MDVLIHDHIQSYTFPLGWLMHALELEIVELRDFKAFCAYITGWPFFCSWRPILVDCTRIYSYIPVKRVWPHLKRWLIGQHTLQNLLGSAWWVLVVHRIESFSLMIGESGPRVTLEVWKMLVIWLALLPVAFTVAWSDPDLILLSYGYITFWLVELLQLYGNLLQLSMLRHCAGMQVNRGFLGYYKSAGKMVIWCGGWSHMRICHNLPRFTDLLSQWLTFKLFGIT